MEDVDKQGSWPRDQGGARERAIFPEAQGATCRCPLHPQERGSVLGSGREEVCRAQDWMRVCLGMWTPRVTGHPAAGPAFPLLL